MTTLARPVVWASILFLIAALPAPLAGAQDAKANPQDAQADTDPYPLRPADTSSPRDTLRSYLTNMAVVIEAWRRKTFSAEADRAYLRAVDTLDMSAVPYGDTWLARNQRLIYLKEVLDRIEVPPDDKIPGDDEVSDGAITYWTIPDTRITIARIEDGPWADKFLFSADTVSRLDRYYRHVLHLPYKPGASINLYEDFLEQEIKGGRSLESMFRNRLKPVDTSSPRSTLLGLLDSVCRAYDLVMEVDAALKASPPEMTKEQAREIEKTANNLLQRAVTTLDLSQVPEAHREDVGIEAVLQLKEILDRTLLPAVDSIPDASMVEAERNQSNLPYSMNLAPVRWRYPNTEIDIVEITQGERQGQFLFSAGTVKNLKNFYDKIRDLPYRAHDDTRVISDEYEWPGVSKGFYDYYITTPGYLVPGISFLSGLVESLPDGLKTMNGGQMAWQWIALFLCVLAAALAAYAIFRVFKGLARRRGPSMNHWLMIPVPVSIAIIVNAVSGFIRQDLNITGNALKAVTASNKAITAVMVIWVVFVLCKAVAETIIASPRIPDKSVDASLLRIGARIIGFLLCAVIAIEAVQDLGVDVVPLLAGLGVGGLAVALGAQRTFANFIGTLILFVNKPVRIGDFCRYGDQVGTVEHIGMLSTRIRSLERTIITVPNAEFSEMKLDNFTKRDQRLFKTVLALRYETTPEQMRYVLAKLRELLLGHPMVASDPARVRFVGYGAYSKDVEVFAYLRCQDQNIFLAIQEDLLLRIEDIINEAGTGFAFPSQTAYLSQDSGLNAERREEAEAQVKQWRAGGRLPFPEFDRQERQRFEDTLDYPPKGSPGYESPADSPDPQDKPPA